ncbi:SHC SH2 domain-binding protein 1 -like protein B [Halotydeus destructor]|nr:SHC SH2 domain-binding protein 1 -like protein B [Halotydeus destructor]
MKFLLCCPSQDETASYSLEDYYYYPVVDKLTRKMNGSFVVQEHYPAVYRMPMEKPHELEDLYRDLLQGVPVSRVHTKLADYVSENVEPIGWKAIWRATEKSSSLNIQCDFQVDVVDVAHHSLEATVIVSRLLSPTPETMTTRQFDDVQALMKQSKISNIPLTELYVISENDADDLFSKTAIVVEHIRFFFKHVWRSWDGITGCKAPTNDMFTEGRLQPRLNLYFDMQNRLIPEATINRIKKLLRESWKIRESLDNLESALQTLPESDRNLDDLSVDEGDIYEGMNLRVQLENIEREMKMLEDPYLRVLAPNLNRARVTDERDSLDERSRCHILSKSYSCKELELVTKKLRDSQSNDTPVEFHNTLEKALQSSRSGDKIYILPGTYICESLPWIESDIEITGISGNKDDVILQASDAVGDIFVNCSSSAILISNVTLVTPAETQCILMVHTGLTSLSNCVLDGGKCARNSIIALSKAEVTLDNCQIIHEKNSTGILKKPGSNVTIDGTEQMEFEPKERNCVSPKPGGDSCEDNEKDVA